MLLTQNIFIYCCKILINITVKDFCHGKNIPLLIRKKHMFMEIMGFFGLGKKLKGDHNTYFRTFLYQVRAHSKVPNMCLVMVESEWLLGG